ncbi:MAG: hypothetical protein AAB405_00135 [Patescibacteria group bacterium]
MNLHLTQTKIFLFIGIFLVMFIFNVISAEAANWYVRPSGGSGSGTNWTTAWNGLNGINWSSVSCGDTVWVAGGAYTQGFNPAKNCTSGNKLFIRRARSDASACTSAAGWSSGYDSLISQTSAIDFVSGQTANYITISGRTTAEGGDYGWKIYRSGTAPGYGIRMWGSSSTNNLTFEYMEVMGDGTSSSMQWTGDAKGIYDAPVSGTSGYHTLSHMKIHGWGTGIFLNYKSDHIIEYIDMYDISGNATEHSNLMYIHASNRGTVRYSKFYNSSVSGTGIAFSDGGPFNDWKIYGNIFYDMSTSTATAISVQQATITGLKMFNNTFSNNVFNFRLSSASCGTGTESKNNIVYGSGGSVSCGSTSNNLTTSDSSIFINAASKDFHIVSTIGSGYPRNAGTNLSGTFIFDMDGVVFGGDDSLWDVGSYEYTIGVDTSPPYRSNGSSTGTLPPGTTSTTLSLITNEAATCKYNTSSGVAYASMAGTFDTTGGTSHSEPLSGLSDGNTYTYYVRCQDSIPNVNTDDYTISFSVASPFSTGAWVEAENCAITSPMATNTESGTTYVYTPTANSGSLTCYFTIGTAGLYKINSNVKAVSGGNDSFFVLTSGVSTVTADVWDVLNSATYTNDYVNRRGAGSPGSPEFDPLELNLLTGTTAITFTGRETDTRLDSLYLARVIDTTPPNAPTGLSIN